ncbi:MAG: GNAT family N-acetyltransferase [Alphaproteobacteria bacterium]|nr:GNAT family N-acetyltransferase [Alphaproteobacteria bacterium]
MQKGNTMNRAIKFKLKNDKIVTIRRIRGTDYDAVVKFFDKAVRDKSVKYTSLYLGQPKQNKDSFVAMHNNPNNLFLGAWYGQDLVGECTTIKISPENPKYRGLTAETGTTILNEFTSNGLGNKFKTIVEKWAVENGVHKLYAEVFHKNIRALNNLMKLGYNIVGIKHNAAIVDKELMHIYTLEKTLKK